MTTLYNCKHSGDQYRITKFTSDFNVEASYLCDLTACECPAGHRPSCRHRQMLSKFITREAVGTEWFFDHDRGGWVQGWKEEPALSLEKQLVGSEPSLEELVSNIEDEEALASAALLSSPSQEPSPILGGFPDWCLNSECTTPNDCILFGCAHGHGTPPRIVAQPLPDQPTLEQRPTCKICGLEDGACICAYLQPSTPTIRRRV